MFIPGVTSRTLLDHEPGRIVELVQAAGLAGIEWDQHHVPVGEMKIARVCRNATEEAGLVVTSYASGARFADSSTAQATVLDTVEALGAAVLAVNVGTRPPRDTSNSDRATLIDATAELADASAQRGVVVGVSARSDSLVPDVDHMLEFIRSVDHENVKCFWHPGACADRERCVATLGKVGKLLVSMYCYAIGDEGWASRILLSEAQDRWAEYLQTAAETGDDHWVLIDGVLEEEPTNFFRDAQTLRRWTERYGSDG